LSPPLEEPRRRRDAAQAEISALTPSPKVVELHPAAVKRYLAAVEDLAGTLSCRMVDGGEDVATALRELVTAVVIHPTGKDEPRIEVRGRLAALTGADLSSQQNIPRTMVAGALHPSGTCRTQSSGSPPERRPLRQLQPVMLGRILASRRHPG
jgi:hypothetical protein